MSNKSKLKIVGIGTVKADAQLVASGMIEPSEITEIKSNGDVGEMLGHFFDAQGRMLETALSQRTLAVDFADLKLNRIVAIAGGADKIEAIRAVLMSACLNGLITGEPTVQSLVMTM